MMALIMIWSLRRIGDRLFDMMHDSRGDVLAIDINVRFVLFAPRAAVRAVAHAPPIRAPISGAVKAMPRMQIVRLGDIFGHPIGDRRNVARIADA